MKRKDPILDEIDRKVRIEDLIEEDGIALERRTGRYLRPKVRGQGLHSLIVDTENNSYHHNGQSEHGDIYRWVMERNGWDFPRALEFLAQKAGVTLPVRDGKDAEKQMAFRVAQRAKEDVFKVAAEVFGKWLWSSEAALAYTRGRGLTDESIRRITVDDKEDGLQIKHKGAGLGFSGTATAAEFDEMRKSFISAGIDPESPAAIAVLGLTGGAERVTAWCAEHKIEPNGSWITKGYIRGLMSKRFPKIIFPHWNGGEVEYLSTRVLEFQADGTLAGAKEPKSLDPWKELAGSPTPYYGFAYRRQSLEVIGQEGQFDVLTTAQWGFSSVGLKGTSWQATAEELKDLAETHQAFYIATDSDEAGQKVVTGEKGDYPLLKITGPMTRWLKSWGEKDANDLLQAMIQKGQEPEKQVAEVQEMLDEAKPLILVVAEVAGRYKKSSPKREVMMEVVVPALNQLTNAQMTDYRMALAKALYPKELYPDESKNQLQQLNKLLKDGKDAKKDEDGKPGEIIETLGGWFPTSDDGEKGYLVEQLYDHRTRQAKFAYRDPDGMISTANFLDINGARIVPMVDENITSLDGTDLPTVLLPSDLGEKKSTRELQFIIETYLRRYFLLDSEVQYELGSLYPFITWSFDMFDEVPYLRARGVSGSGKSELMTRIGLICYRLMLSTGASSVASMKYMCHIYRGTLMLDECDKFAKDEFDERNVMLRVGFSKSNGKVIAMMETQVGGSKTFRPVATRVYGPKLLTMYKSFADEGNENRCVTFELRDKEVQELINRGIPTNDPRDIEIMRMEAERIRNLMVRWKLETFRRRPEIKAGLQLRDPKVSNRINQIAMPLKILAQDDPEMLKKIDRFLQRNYENEVNKRAEKPEARVLDAVVSIMEKPEFEKYKFIGRVRTHGVVTYAFYADIANLANKMMDEMNAQENDTDEDKKKRKRKQLSPNGIGYVCRDDLGLETDRVGKGSVVVLDPERIEILKVKYGAGEWASVSADNVDHYEQQAELLDG